MPAPWSRVAISLFRGAVLAPCRFFAALLLLVLPCAAFAQIHGPNPPIPTPEPFYHPSSESAQSACLAALPTTCLNSCLEHDGNHGTAYGPPGDTRSWGLSRFCPAFTYYWREYFYPVPACEAGQTFEPPYPGTCVGGSGPTSNKKLGCSGSGVGNPCDAATGNKYQVESDYRSGDELLTFARHYNSQFEADVGLGMGWTSTFHRQLEIDGTDIIISQTTGRSEPFTCTGSGPCSGDPDTKLLLDQDATGYTLTLADSASERYDLNGRLVAETDRAGKTTTYGYDANGDLETITGPFGHALTLIHDANGWLATLIDPAGGVYAYGYDVNGNLTQVTYPDTTVRIYHYEDTAYPNHLTGITDENGDRFATYAYDANGNAISTEHAGGQERFTLAYDSDTQTTVTDAGTQQVMTFGDNLGVRNLLTNINQTDGKGATQIFDANNNLTRRIDEEGRITDFAYNADNQRISMTEAVGTSEQRTTNFTYVSDDIDLPTVVSMPSVVTGQKQVTTTYDANNNPIQITQSGFAPAGTPVSRTITLQYNSLGQVAQIDGSRTDVSDVITLIYYDCNTGIECGQLQSVTNALGHITTFDTYDAHGRVTQLTDPNGVVTTFTYDPRGRVLTQTQTPPTGPVRITATSYDNAGLLTSTMMPDGITLNYSYDAAHNLIAIQDNLGNLIEYTYDLKGNRTQEQTKDPGGTLVRDIQTGYDIRNRVESINAAGSLTQLVNDAVGNLTSQTDPNANPPKAHTYDPLDRLSETMDALSGMTSYDYDVNDQLVQVTTPNNASTQYIYDDWGNLLKEISPDRGTLTFGYNDAGNVISQIDARGVKVSYSYDALNRLTFIHYPDSTEDVTFTYDVQGCTSTGGAGCAGAADACANGVGRLCVIQDESGTTTLAYDPFGNVTQHDKTELGITYTTEYTYDLDDRITSITYPDGRIVTYTRDALGRITDVSMTVNGAATNLVNSLTYRADGLLTGQTFGNGIAETRDYDLQGRLLTQTIGAVDTRIYTYDANSNVTAFTGNAASTSYGYDALDRLTEDTASLSTSSFTYDANGNRLTRVQDGKTLTYNYEPNTNRLDQVHTATEPKDVVLDAAGNTLSDRNTKRTFTYDNAGRMDQFFKQGLLKATYTYNAQGQRTRKVKVNNKGKIKTFVYHYDLLGNLIAETREDGSVRRVYVWVDNRPLAQIKHKRNANEDILSYLHTDHLNTPRIATNNTQTVVWRWESRAFGNFKIEKDPDRDGTNVNVRLRFPGQFKDGESGLYYNWNRYYDPGKGRYITSDPIGVLGILSGGAYTLSKDQTQIPLLATLGQSRIPNELLTFTRSLNVYGYVDGNPLRYFDPMGLDRYDICRDFGPLGEAVCKGCVGAVCGIPGVDRICCKVDFDGCIGESGGDRAKMQECAAKFNACTLKKPKKLPSKPNSGCGDDGGCI